MDIGDIKKGTNAVLSMYVASDNQGFVQFGYFCTVCGSMERVIARVFDMLLWSSVV